MLHQKYYKEYGLAIEGLTRHHKIDPLSFNREVDDALPLDEILKPDPKLRAFLQDLDTTKVKPWLLTNAYVTHGKRVVKLLGVDDLFEGITYCDYGQERLICKPADEMWEKAEKEAGAKSIDDCYFVGKILQQFLTRSQRTLIENDIQMTLHSTVNTQSYGVGRQHIWSNRCYRCQ